MPYYHTCPECGSNLDPGEKCDCDKTEHTPNKNFKEDINNDGNQNHRSGIIRSA